MKRVLAIDIGGTAIKLGLVADDGRLLWSGQIAFDRRQPVAELVERIATEHDTISLGHARPDAVAVAMPGYVDPASGRIVDGGFNVPALRDASIVLALRQRFGLPVHFANDGVAAALGELKFGAGRELGHFVLMTIGTGVGGAVILDGKPVVGRQGEPPEIGAIVIGSDAAGLPVSLEAQSSAPAMLQAYAAQTGQAPDSAQALFALADGGDAAAEAAIDRACRGMTQAAGALINALRLDAIVLGGGVSGAGDGLVRRIRHHLPENVWPSLAAQVEIRIAALGNTAGLLGVASLAFEGSAASPARRNLARAGRT